jgi:hypothetical protein
MTLRELGQSISSFFQGIWNGVIGLWNTIIDFYGDAFEKIFNGDFLDLTIWQVVFLVFGWWVVAVLFQWSQGYLSRDPK